MSTSPALSTTSSFSSVSSFSSLDSEKSFSVSSSRHILPPVLRRQRPSHKRTTSEFVIPSSSHSHKVRKTAHKSKKNILLWPSQLHSLNVASQEAKQRASTPAVSRQPSMEPQSSTQHNTILLGYMELLQRQRQENLADLQRQRTATPSVA